MEEHKEELATIESIDSGAVYTLALKTHVGMSIETWRYFAGWCDKIQGSIKVFTLLKFNYPLSESNSWKKEKNVNEREDE